MRYSSFKSVVLAALLLVTTVTADGLRGSTPIEQEARPPAIAKPTNDDIRQVRSYPEQPPVIPHSIRNYQIDLNFNKCLVCHSRTAAPAANAPMVSVTHFMNRDGQVLTDVSARRYFCTQCHVVQTDVRVLIPNTFDSKN